MHISDGVASFPLLCAGGVISAAGVTVGLSRLKDEQIPKAALLSAVIFVGSAIIRLPIGPASVHPILNGLAGLVLGWAAMPVFLIVLFLQALLFLFGGITTLGINTVTMGLPAVMSYYCFVPVLRRARTARAAFVVGVAATASALVLSFALWLAALLLSGRQFAVIAQLAVLPHLLLVVAESIFVGFVVSFLYRVYPSVFSMTDALNRGR